MDNTEDMAYKVRENRLRRAARRQGLMLQKFRGRDGRALNHCTYQLIDPFTNAMIWGSQQGYGLSLDEIETALALTPTTTPTNTPKA